ncbi:hypothetical protein TRVL_07858 [Trypanosoma vivax]|nr:hypothetical protein TRVL_07858 [Trypanosoma vivax]
MQVSQRLRCGARTPLPSASESAKARAPTVFQRRAFAPLNFQSWQTRCLGTIRSKWLPQSLMYHGAYLGPRPLLILDHTTRGQSHVAEAVKKYEPMLSQLEWDYGAVYIPLSTDCMASVKDLIHHSCLQICAVMDALDIRWTHFLAYSYGALVAARMASSEEFPHRIGTLISVDTPLVTRELVRNTEQREEIAKAEVDVNVPEGELSFAKQALLSSLEGPLPCPSEADQVLYRDYLFDSAKTFNANGLVRCDERYVSVRHLVDIRHPIQLIVPAEGALTDVGIHSECLGLRRPSVIKSCRKHSDLFSELAATEVASVLGAWVRRFEPDMFLAKRYEQAAREMEQLMATSTLSPTASASVSGREERKKKEKKKKF